MSFWPHNTTIYATCKQCGGYLTESSYGSGYYDFRTERDPHHCTANKENTPPDR